MESNSFCNRWVSESIQNASWIRRMFEEGRELKARLGPDALCDLSLGNPTVEPPAAFFEAVHDLADAEPAGHHRYMTNIGRMDTRQAVAGRLSRESGLSYRPDDIVMTVGAAGGLNVLFHTVLNPGDEVLIFAPYFVEYTFYLRQMGAVPVIVETTERFDIDPKRVKEALTPKTRAVIINSPNNPTGRLISRDQLDALGQVLGEADEPILLVSDEPYRDVIFDGLTYPTPDRSHDATITIGSYSKTLAIPGERIGYVAVSPTIDSETRDELLAGMAFTMRTLGFVNAPAFMQRVIARIPEAHVDPAIYQRKRDRLLPALREAGYECVTPEGAFYLFPRSPIPDDVAFAYHLQKERILVVPGVGFGRPGHFRISYCVPDDVIERAIERFQKALETLPCED